MRPRSHVRLRLVRTILAIAAAYLLAAQGISASLAASVHTAQRIDRLSGPLCLTDGGSPLSDTPIHAGDEGGCCSLHCAGQGFAAPLPRLAGMAAPTWIEAAASGAAERSHFAPSVPCGAFSARAPPSAA
jgi:hypothetical protein